MSVTMSIGTPPVAVSIRRSANARRLTLRLNQFNHKATLTVPLRTRQSQISDYLTRQEGWLRAQIAKAPQRVFPAIGISLPVEGESLKLVTGEGRSVRRQPGLLIIPGGTGAVRPKLRAYLKTLARERVSDATRYYANILGTQISRLTLRDTRSRWGSCTSTGNLMFSWRLAMAPPDVLRYVAAHEVGHLVHMDHSPAFWHVVKSLMSEFEAPRSWLRREGANLHRFDFEGAA